MIRSYLLDSGARRQTVREYSFLRELLYTHLHRLGIKLSMPLESQNVTAVEEAVVWAEGIAPHTAQPRGHSLWCHIISMDKEHV